MKKHYVKDIRRFLLIIAAACIMAMNLKSLVRPGGLIPGGFNGLTLLLQEIGLDFFHVTLPFTALNLLLNAAPIAISFRFIGKKFTSYSCLMIFLTGILTDILPAWHFTDDILLIAVFGGLINACAISICLFAHATSGGTDFIAIFLSERYGIDSWNYILMGNVVILLIAGALFGWGKALYSIIFQFTSTQVLHALYQRYQKHTLFIITKKPEEVYQVIKKITNHDATLFKGTGCYEKKECSMLYSVISSDEVRKVTAGVRNIDKQAFINSVKTEHISGTFYQRPND